MLGLEKGKTQRRRKTVSRETQGGGGDPHKTVESQERDVYDVVILECGQSVIIIMWSSNRWPGLAVAVDWPELGPVTVFL